MLVRGTVLERNLFVALTLRGRLGGLESEIFTSGPLARALEIQMTPKFHSTVALTREHAGIESQSMSLARCGVSACEVNSANNSTFWI